MTDDKKYNGWTNYETWVVNLWMDNEESTYQYWKEEAEQAWEAAATKHSFPSYTRKDKATIALADTLKANHEESQPEITGVFADLLGAALSEVDWREIAEHLLDEYEEEEEPSQNG